MSGAGAAASAPGGAAATPAVLLTGAGKRYDIVSCFAHLTRTVVADPSPLAPAGLNPLAIYVHAPELA